MKPIDNARPIAPQRITPLQSITKAGAARAGAGSSTPVPPPADAIASIAAHLSATGEAPVDAARVDAIRDAIKRGEYPLEPGAIADAMIGAGYLKRDTE